MKTISYSSMRAFEECPLRYKFNYIDRIKVPYQSNIYGAFGSALHLCIQKFYEGNNFTREALLSLWEGCFNKEIYKQKVEKVSTRESSRLLNQGYPILQKFYTKQKKQGLLKKPIATELEFNISCKNKYGDNVLLVGKIDIIFETENGFEIIDFKSTANKYQWQDNKVALQLVIYYLAFKLLKREYKNADCKICLHFLRPSIKNYFTITKRDKIKALKSIGDHLRDVKFSDFKPQPTKENCKYCPYTEMCSVFKINDNILKKKLFPYQKSDVAFMIKNKRILNANEMGLGKTIETIYVGEKLHADSGVNNILVVTPNNMKYQWHDKIEEFTKKPSIEIVKGSRNNRRKLYDNDALWTIVSYDSLGNDIGYVNRVWDMIVLDDPSAFKNYKTKVRKAIDKLKINKDTNFKQILIATPIENNLFEIYSIIRYLDFRIFGKFISFDRRYVKRNYFNSIIGYKNIFEFMDKIKPILIRNKVDKVQKDLPPVILKYDYIDFLPEQAKLYDAVVDSMRDFLEGKIVKGKEDKVIDSEALAKFTYLRELCDSTELIGKEKHSAKTQRLKELLNKILPNKVIVFSEFASMLKILNKILKQKTIFVSGKDSAEEKDKKVNEFKNSKIANILLCTDVLKYGQDLQCAHYMINFDMPFKFSTLEQRWGRERRIGQKAKKIIVTNMIMKNSCEDRMLEILEYKKKLSKIIDGVKYDKIDLPLSSGITYKKLNGIINKEK